MTFHEWAASINLTDPIVLVFAEQAWDKSKEPYLWRGIKSTPPPSGKIQMYTKYGVAIIGHYHKDWHDYIIAWAPLLPSPSKQKGELK